MDIKKVWDWLKSIWFIGSNIIKIVKGQEEVSQRLDKIEQDIKSPRYQVAELEKIKLTIDLVKENNEQEKIMLQRGSQEEINKHKAKIEELTQTNKELAEYKELVVTAIGIIKQKDLEIKKLNAQVEELREKAPSALSSALAGRLGQPLSSELLINILGRHKSREDKNE